MVSSIDAAMVSSAARTLMLGIAGVCFLVLQRAVALTGYATTFPSDAAALAALRAAVDPSSVPAHSCLASWGSARDPCRDFLCGLRCYVPPNSSYHRVISVSLEPGAGYVGTLPATVFTSLPFLEYLSVTDNRFDGKLPAGIPLQQSLRFLDLSRNAFSGEIPGSLFTLATSLEEIDLSRNAFSGRIPPQIASLVVLRRLELENNFLTGNLPRMEKMLSLAYLDVTGNALSGSVRDALGQLPGSIVSVVAMNNSFAGPLPAAFLAALPALAVLDLTSNAVTGAVPGAVFVHPSLEELKLPDNHLDSVEAAPDGGASSQIEVLNLGGNRLTGRLPGFLAAMPKLRMVSLDRNRFTGGIPKHYAVRVTAENATDKWVPFARLMLQGNYLCGALPSQLRQLKEEDAVVSLADNCFRRCPHMFFFCQGAPQKSDATCPKCYP
ncbi:hypothetical protein GUJ93_ZPchr0006g42518 [Zizania palustris]|uniref:Leucine-rich repeat-containing N-terminal plant-type domain-containing protein n=1 Tax=Zizania palustris TaxID=103762 RepID=A0A8J5SL36_ZIZPA|nr:hypothetical protein GUJ93_ZPchr0006g42518 [Zizania palustris]